MINKLSSLEAQWVVTKSLALCGKDKLRGTRWGTGVGGVIEYPTVKYWPPFHWGKNGAVDGQNIIAKGGEILSVFSLKPLLQQFSSHHSYTLLSI